MEENNKIEFFQCTLEQYENREHLEPKELESSDSSNNDKQ